MKNIYSLILAATTLTLVSCETIQTEDLYFSSVPSEISDHEAQNILYKALLRRHWEVARLEDQNLQAELEHNGYRALLKFTITENEIKYSDYTTYYSYSSETRTPSTAPKRWIVYLQRDTEKAFRNALLKKLERTPEQE